MNTPVFGVNYNWFKQLRGTAIIAVPLYFIILEVCHSFN